MVFEVERVPVLTPVTSENENASGVVSGGGAGVVTLKTHVTHPILRVELVVTEFDAEAFCCTVTTSPF